MKNLVLFLLCAALLVTAMIIGAQRTASPTSEPAPSAVVDSKAMADDNVPNVGSILILNGCGVPGAANKVADFLRARRFDVKNTGNAPTSNYKETIVVSRKKGCVIARQVAASLHSAKVVFIRNGDELYDAIVFIGMDYPERIK